MQLKNLLSEAIMSVTGNRVITYFETAQGSKYILTDKGESKRIKSLHANTGANDVGVKSWYPMCLFVNPKDEHEANAVMQLMDKGFKVLALSLKNNKAAIYIRIDNKWVLGNWTHAYPKSNKDKPLVFEYTNKPTVGFNALEVKLDNNTIKSYHFGSPVSKILPIDQVDISTIKKFAG